MNIFKTARGLVIAAFMAAGFWKGFSWPVVIGTIAMFVLHHWPELVMEFRKDRADIKSGNIPGLREDFDRLKDKVNGLAITQAFRQSPPPQKTS